MAAAPALAAAQVQAAEGAARQRGRSEAERLDVGESGATLGAAREVDIDGLLKRLHLANARRVWRDLVVRAEQAQWSFRDFLAVLVAEEVAQRQQTRVQRLSRRAGFPFLKTIDDFDFTYQTTVKLSLLGSALSPDFVTDGRSLVLHGKPGRGKTHLAVAIAYRAIQNGFDALFVTAAELIDDLSGAFRAGRLADALVRYVGPDVLVVDEVGYLTYGTDAANMLYHVVNERHRRRRSMVFTSNKHPDAWGGVLHDDDLAQAIVDRVLERGRLLKLDGPSLRTKHLGLDAPESAEAGSSQVVRISGTGSSEFPEPTSRAARQSWATGRAQLDRAGPRSPRRRAAALAVRTHRTDLGPPERTTSSVAWPRDLRG
jgi:DNA replication protein DnaC